MVLTLEMRCLQVRDGVLPGDGAEPHGFGELSHPDVARVCLPLGHAVCPPAQQEVLDDGHHLY